VLLLRGRGGLDWGLETGNGFLEVSIIVLWMDYVVWDCCELLYLCRYGELYDMIGAFPMVSYWAYCSVRKSTLAGALGNVMREQGFVLITIFVELVGKLLTSLYYRTQALYYSRLL